MAVSDLGKQLAHLRTLSDGTYEPPRPSIDVENAALFAGLSRVTLEGGGEAELAPGLLLRPAYAHVFAPPMVAVSAPERPRAPHPSPWYALEGGGIAETAKVEVSLATGARLFGLPRLTALRLVASIFRLVSAQPVCMPVLCNVPLADARQPDGPAHMWQLERPPAVHGQPVRLDPSFIEAVVRFLPSVEALATDADLSRAFTLADGMWWLPTLEAQLTTIWTVVEMLMRPGRRDTTKEMGRAVRAYASFDRSSGDRLYQEVVRLYFARGTSAHAGAEPAATDVQASYMILRGILLRALSERSRPPKPEDIVQLW
jgi:hypothetical protein